MADTNVSALDNTVHKTNEWLAEIERDAGLEGRHGAYVALRAVLTAVRDRLPVDAAADLGAQLPHLVRGIYYDQFRPVDQPVKVRGEEAFLARVAEGFGDSDHIGADPKTATRAVLATLTRHIEPTAAKKARDMLDDDAKPLWPIAA